MTTFEDFTHLAKLTVLPSKCPVCSEKAVERNVASMSAPRDKDRFALCPNGHRFAERPYTNYDEDFIFDDQIEARMQKLTAELQRLSGL